MEFLQNHQRGWRNGLNGSVEQTVTRPDDVRALIDTEQHADGPRLPYHGSLRRHSKSSGVLTGYWAPATAEKVDAQPG